MLTDRDLVSFGVMVKETDLLIRARVDLKERALELVWQCRAELERYIADHPLFLETLEPLRVSHDAPQIVRDMAEAARRVGVGPMAAVAGGIAEFVGRGLLPFSPEVIVENGGDIFLKITKRRVAGIYAGESAFTGKIGFEIQPEDTPLGICTSSGTVGHSLSFGTADAAIAFSPSAALADAAATAIGNLVATAEDIPAAINFAQGIPLLQAVAIVKDSTMGLWGKLKLVEI